MRNIIKTGLTAYFVRNISTRSISHDIFQVNANWNAAIFDWCGFSEVVKIKSKIFGMERIVTRVCISIFIVPNKNENSL